MTTNNTDSDTQPNRTPQRVRHALRFRAVEVVKSERITPHLLRITLGGDCLLYTSPSPRDQRGSRMPSSA